MLEMLWELFAKDEIPTFCNGTTFGNGKIRPKAEFNVDTMESSVDVPEKITFQQMKKFHLNEMDQSSLKYLIPNFTFVLSS